jgi:predicted homoserine dehydrogenase-like protein
MLGINEKLARMQEEGEFIHVAVIGTGQMGRGLISYLKGVSAMKLVAAADKVASKTVRLLKEMGYDSDRMVFAGSKNINAGIRHIDISNCKNTQEKKDLIAKNSQDAELVISDDICAVASLEDVDVVVDATGNPEAGANIAFSAIMERKHIVTMNVEADVTIGPILKKLADNAGIVYTLAAGDEPGAVKELFDFADALGLEIISAGKGKNNPLDKHANPKTLEAYSKEKGANPYMMTSFVDGTKSMEEMACVSNATGLVPDCPGMHGPKADIAEIAEILKPKKDGGILDKKGCVDFVTGDLAPGVFLVFTTSNDILHEDLKYLKMGNGPYYLLYRPYHLANIEVPLSIARAYLYNEATIAPKSGLISEVVTIAKTDMEKGDVIDGIGGFKCYGQIETYENAKRKKLLPLGLCEGAVLKRKITKDALITFDDVEIDECSLIFKLRKMQEDFIG